MYANVLKSAKPTMPEKKSPPKKSQMAGDLGMNPFKAVKGYAPKAKKLQAMKTQGFGADMGA